MTKFIKRLFKLLTGDRTTKCNTRVKMHSAEYTASACNYLFRIITISRRVAIEYTV